MRPNISLASTEQNLEQFLRKKPYCYFRGVQKKIFFARQGWEGRMGGKEGNVEGRTQKKHLTFPQHLL